MLRRVPVWVSMSAQTRTATCLICETARIAPAMVPCGCGKAVSTHAPARCIASAANGLRIWEYSHSQQTLFAVMVSLIG